MERQPFARTILGASFAGLLFSGYLSGVKFFSGSCAFNESCPFFFGYPACYFGFILFLVLALASVPHAFCDKPARVVIVRTVIRVVSFLGILFAGYFTLGELPRLLSDGLSAYLLGLPTCALGFVFFLFIFVLSCKRKRDRTESFEVSTTQ